MTTLLTLISKTTAATTAVTASEHQPVHLTEPSIIKMKVPHATVKSLARAGDDLVITLMGGEVVTVKGDSLIIDYKSGEVITIQNYFLNANGLGNDLTLEDHDGLWLADLLGSAGDLVVGYTPIDTIAPLLAQQDQHVHAASTDVTTLDGAFGWWALALGGVAISALGSSGDGSHSYPPPAEQLPDAPALALIPDTTGTIAVAAQLPVEGSAPGTLTEHAFISGGGNETFNLLDGAHSTLVYKLLGADNTGGNGTDTINGFQVGQVATTPNATRIALGELLIGYHPANADGHPAHEVNGVATIDAGDAIADYLQVTQNGADTIIRIDRDGQGDAYAMETLLLLHNTQTDLAILLANQQIGVV